MTIDAGPTGKSLEQLGHEASRGMTASAIEFGLNDLGENEGGELIKKVLCDGSTGPGDVVATVKAGETKKYNGVILIGS